MPSTWGLQRQVKLLRDSLRRLEQIVIDAGIFPEDEDRQEAALALTQARKALIETGGYDAHPKGT